MIRNITVSGRIASGTTTLAKGISETLGWELLEGGELFEQYFNAEKGSDADRADEIDLGYEKMVQDKLRNGSQQIIQSHLAGFDAQGIEGVYKILVVCEDKEGIDHPDIRIDRLVNRKGISVEDAKKEVKEREEKNLEKWRRLYANNDPKWIYWDKKYYDLVINTYSLNKQEAITVALNALSGKTLT
jgi:cytidylate kinase